VSWQCFKCGCFLFAGGQVQSGIDLAPLEYCYRIVCCRCGDVSFLCGSKNSATLDRFTLGNLERMDTDRLNIPRIPAAAPIVGGIV